MPVQKVTRKHSGKGSISALVTIPRGLYKLWGEPGEVLVELVHDFMLLIIPSREVLVEEASMEYASRVRKTIRPDRKIEASSATVNEHIRSQTIAHGPPVQVLVECGTTRALILYSDGYAEEIVYAYDCGHRGTGPGTLRRLVAWLAGRELTDSKIDVEVKERIADPRTKIIIVELEPDLIAIKAVQGGEEETRLPGP